MTLSYKEYVSITIILESMLFQYTIQLSKDNKLTSKCEASIFPEFKRLSDKFCCQVSMKQYKLYITDPVN